MSITSLVDFIRRPLRAGLAQVGTFTIPNTGGRRQAHSYEGWGLLLATTGDFITATDSLGALTYVAPAILDSFTPQTALATSAPPCLPIDIADGTEYALNAQCDQETFGAFTPIIVLHKSLLGVYSITALPGTAPDGTTFANVTVGDQTITFTVSGLDLSTLGDPVFNGTYTLTTLTCGDASQFSGSFQSDQAGVTNASATLGPNTPPPGP